MERVWHGDQEQWTNESPPLHPATYTITDGQHSTCPQENRNTSSFGELLLMLEKKRVPLTPVYMHPIRSPCQNFQWLTCPTLSDLWKGHDNEGTRRMHTACVQSGTAHWMVASKKTKTLVCSVAGRVKTPRKGVVDAFCSVGDMEWTCAFFVRHRIYVLDIFLRWPLYEWIIYTNYWNLVCWIS